MPRPAASHPLEESQLRLELAIEASGLALFDWYPASDVVELSEQWARIMGAAPGPVRTTGQALRERLHPEEAPLLMEQVRALLKGHTEFYDVEHRVRADDGAWRWIASRARVTARGPDGRAMRVTGTNADVTYRKAVERMKDEFVARVSHELRAPLASMMASLELLREGREGALPAAVQSSVEVAWANGQRLVRLVNDILDLERIQAGTMRLEVEPMRIDLLLARAVSLNAPAAERGGARLVLEDPTPSLVIEADPDRLLQVLTNLVANAVKFSPPGGAVRIKAQAHDGFVRISVADQGCGIERSMQQAIFSRFVATPNAEREHRAGTGLGLSISKALIERMGGRIGVESSPGEGATFFVDLPAAIPQGAASPASPAA